MARNLPSPRFGEASFKQNVFHAYAEAGTTIEDVCHPEYFSIVAAYVKPGDEIVVHWDDMTAHARLYVRAQAHGSLRVEVLSHVEFDAVAPRTGEVDFEVKHRGPHHKFSIVRKSDGEVIRTGFATRAEADAVLAEHLKTFG